MIESPKNKVHIVGIDNNFQFFYAFLIHFIFRIVLIRMWHWFVRVLLLYSCHIPTVFRLGSSLNHILLGEVLLLHHFVMPLCPGFGPNSKFEIDIYLP